MKLPRNIRGLGYSWKYLRICPCLNIEYGFSPCRGDCDKASTREEVSNVMIEQGQRVELVCGHVVDSKSRHVTIRWILYNIIINSFIRWQYHRISNWPKDFQTMRTENSLLKIWTGRTWEYTRGPFLEHQRQLVLYPCHIISIKRRRESEFDKYTF